MPTLECSRRGFHRAFSDERPGPFLEAHERAFEHFGGHTHELLYHQPRTECRPSESGSVVSDLLDGHGKLTHFGQDF